MTFSAIVSHREPEVVSTEDATVTKFARLAAGGELHEAGTGGDIYGERHTLLTTDHVTVACCYIPHAPGYALYDFYEGFRFQSLRGQGAWSWQPP